MGSAQAISEGVLSGTARKHDLGQFLTPPSVADLMASLFQTRRREVFLLDAGAGKGALTAALVRRLCHGRRRPKRISVTAYEIDDGVIHGLRETLDRCGEDCGQAGISWESIVHQDDFIAAGVSMVRGGLFAPPMQLFNMAIVNPPYHKIRTESLTRRLLDSIGVPTTNMYAGFLALIVRLLSPSGELVAITPRSFCNGPYFRPFREDLLEKTALRQLHVFDSRSAAFKGDSVLQENVILHAVRGSPAPEQVVISTSSGEPGGRVTKRRAAYCDVVSPEDPEQFIHLAVGDGHHRARSIMSRLPATLGDLGIDVSTGRVVDFRARSCLRQEPGTDTAPLIYPCHFQDGFVAWPKPEARKPNAIVDAPETRDLLVPGGVYVLVKRFTAKEERRRVVACIYDPARVRAPRVGFENHLNYFHAGGKGLPMPLAQGLAAFLNSTVVDTYFRQFSGHTQVNATDLRTLRYPAAEELERWGRAAGLPKSQDRIVQEDWDG